MEIERKFLMHEMPKHLDIKQNCWIQQGYISTDPEVRIRLKLTSEGITYKLTFKGNGDLGREETEIELTKEQYHKLLEMIDRPLIQKNYFIFHLPTDKKDYELEFSTVDRGTPKEFMYAEIEFESEEEALSFVPPSFLGPEITYDSFYKMKNYWLRTNYPRRD